MKTIGIIGGMSWESTVEYYRIINQEIAQKLGGLHSAKILIESYDFSEIESLQKQGNWDELNKILSTSAQKLEKSGSDFIAIATNTMHLCAPFVQSSIDIPLIHITDASAKVIKSQNIDTVALLGTKYTMNKSFYKDKLKEDFDINVVLPENEEQDCLNGIIFDELCKGIIKEDSKNKLNKIIENCNGKGAQAAILGCTELPNILNKACIPLIDTTKAHCLAIVDEMLKP